MLKKCKLVVLPSNEKAEVLWLTNSNQLIYTHVSEEYKEKYQPQHLFILSDEDIKEGNYIYHSLDEKITFCDKGNLKILEDCSDKTGYGYKKIIATTNSNLKIGPFPKLREDSYYSLPQIPQQFIEHYVSEYNKGNIINEVNVEYEKGMPDIIDFDDVRKTYDLVVNSNNEISIELVKEIWNRDEVILLISKVLKENRSFHDYVQEACGITEYAIPHFEKNVAKWIKNNL